MFKHGQTSTVCPCLNMYSVVVTNVITGYKLPEKNMSVHVTNVILQCSVSCGGIIKHAIIFSFTF